MEECSVVNVLEQVSEEVKREVSDWLEEEAAAAVCMYLRVATTVFRIIVLLKTMSIRECVTYKRNQSSLQNLNVSS